MDKWLIVFLGGGLGSVLRFVVSSAIQRSANGAFPYGTLTVNVVGCCVIGALWGLSGRMNLPFLFSLFLFSGILGGFTTFSSFGIETLSMIHDGAWRMAFFYIALSNILGLGFAALGFFVVAGLK